MTKLAASTRHAAYLMFDAGLGENSIMNFFQSITPASKKDGYFYTDDVRAYIKEMSA